MQIGVASTDYAGIVGHPEIKGLAVGQSISFWVWLIMNLTEIRVLIFLCAVRGSPHGDYWVLLVTAPRAGEFVAKFDQLLGLE
jgi:hypothetical protein